MTEFKDFLEDLRRTWEKVMNEGDVAPLTRFFHAPYFAVGPDGGVTLTDSEAKIRAFNQSRLELFHSAAVATY